MTSETDAAFLDRLEATPRYNPSYRTLDSDRLFDLARRGADAADRIAQLEAEGDKARARGDKLRMALEDIAYGHNEDDLMRIARAALEERT